MLKNKISSAIFSVERERILHRKEDALYNGVSTSVRLYVYILTRSHAGVYFNLFYYIVDCFYSFYILLFFLIHFIIGPLPRALHFFTTSLLFY